MRSAWIESYGVGRTKKFLHRRGNHSDDTFHSTSFEWQRLENDISQERVKPAGLLHVLPYCGPDKKWVFLGALGCMLSGLVMPIYAFLYAEIFNTFTLTGEELRRSAAFWSLMFVALAVLGGIGAMIRTIGMGFAGDSLTTRMRLLCFKNILRQNIAWFDEEKHSTGKLSTRLATDAPMVKAAAGHRLGIVLAAVVTIIGAMALAFVFGWKLALAISAASPVLVIAGFIQIKVQKFAQQKDAVLMEGAGNVASQAIQNIRTVQALNRERTFFIKYINQLLEPFREAKKQAYVYGLVYSFSQGVIFLIYAGAFRLGAYLVSIEDMSPTNVYRVFFAIAFCAISVGQMNSYISEYSKAKLSAGLLIGLIKRRPEIDSYSSYGVFQPVKGKVGFRDVHFSYPQRAQVPVLQGLSATVSPGQTLAVVGPSGCGKSTVISLIQRFYDPLRGQVTVDDVDLRSYNLQHIRRQISVVSQEPVLFDCSIRENITYGLQDPDFVPLAEVEAAAKSANIHDFIVSLSQGYETRVGDKGTQLSGGQKQRIAIARALIRDPKILLLDEATSALDTESEKVVQEAIEKARVGRTCIIVAHRLSTIQSADCIAVMDRGRIVELGTHEDLRAKKGIYYQLTKRQQISH
ncbi:unnamed protein product [Notodromas monacha]|uniref:ABC-type xenobiotic transporter n=1 Tax=Notodromas monacha TaxID=399045 RepID=A0A7R9BWY1_9CRUS|nr:unnamed protein product [Notodromas monacha]CAG0923234.1 unnamed protein product [Notodromas monacha]